jgi:hypothetical protein
MTHRTMTLEELKGRGLEDVLREVADRLEFLTVRLPDGREIQIQPSADLKPLPVLKGKVPEGWRDAIYR